MRTADPVQYMTALAKANKTRLERAQVKRALHAGKLSLREAVEHEAMQTCTVYDVLCAQHYWGDAKAKRLLRLLAMSEGKRCGSLTDRQVTVLVNSV